MLTPKTTAAMIAALSVVAMFGAFTTVADQTAFAQVTQTNTNTNTATATITANPTASGSNSLAFTIASISQEQGNCQMNVGANDDSTASGTFESDDCS
jgi:hypothetical protein